MSQQNAMDVSLDELERVVTKWRRIGLAAKDVIEQKQSTFRARNGRDVGVEDDRGEKMWIVPFEAIAALEAALQDDGADGEGVKR
jgi:hypothetical protein